MNDSDYIVSTISLARDQKEADRILKSLKILATKEFSKIIVYDGGSPIWFLNELSNIKQIELFKPSQKGLWPQVYESLKKATTSKAPYVLYTESDKATFFENKLDAYLSEANTIIEKDADFGMIIPSRNKKSYESFPAFQQYTESIASNLIDKVNAETQQNDYIYGPKIVSKSLLPYLEKITFDIGWGWYSYLAIISKKLKKKNYFLEMDFPNPVINEVEDDAQKIIRLKQLKDHVNAVHFACTISI